MSLYTTTSTDIAPGVSVLSEEALAMGGAAIAATGVVAATAAAGVVFGAGWLLYQAGNLMYSEMERAKMETEERERQERIRNEQRTASAQADRGRIVNKCSELKNAWQESLQMAGESLGNPELVEELFESIRQIEEYELKNDPDSMEHDNGSHWELLAKASRQMEALVKEFYEAMEQSAERAEAAELLKTLYGIMQKTTLESNAAGHDVQGQTVEEEKIRLIRQQAQILAASIRYAMEREEIRQSSMPVDSSSRNYLKQLFEGIEEKIEAIIEQDLSLEEMEVLVNDLEKRMAQYRVKAAELNDDEEYFTCTYQAYEGVCKGLLEEVKAKEEFTSVKELDETMAHMEERVARMEECARIYGQLGRDAYICHAFDVEMKKLGYRMIEKKKASGFIIEDYVSHMEEEDNMTYYELPDGSMTQFYKISEETYVQVIVRSDGTTSMETFTSDDYADEAKVIADQKSHCAKHEKLSKALKENWFVITKIDELVPPEIVTVRKSMTDDNPTYGEDVWKEEETITPEYQTFD